MMHRLLRKVLFIIINHMQIYNFYKILYTSIIVGAILITVYFIFIKLKHKLTNNSKRLIYFIVLTLLIFPIFSTNKISNDIPIIRQVQKIQNIPFYINNEYSKELENYNRVKRDYGENSKETIKQENKMKFKFISSKIIQYIPCIYTFVVWLLICINITKYIIFNMKIKNKYIKNERLYSILEVYKEKLNITRKIKIILYDEIDEPILYGIFRPRIIINSKISCLKEEDIKPIIEELLVQYKIKSNLYCLYVKIIGIINFFNPIIIWVLKDILRVNHSSCKEKKEFSDAEKYKNSHILMLAIIFSILIVYGLFFINVERKNIHIEYVQENIEKKRVLEFNIKELAGYKNTYITKSKDAEKILKKLNAKDYLESVEYKKVKEKEPLTLYVNYNYRDYEFNYWNDKYIDVLTETNAVALFALIDNLEYIEIKTLESRYYTRENLEKKYRKDLSYYINHPEEFKKEVVNTINN